MPKQGEHNIRILNKEYVTSIEILKQPEEMKAKDKLRFDKEVQYMITNTNSPSSSSESKREKRYDINMYNMRGEKTVQCVEGNTCLVGRNANDEEQALFNKLNNMFRIIFFFFLFIFFFFFFYLL
jgi:hypothetical protein